MTTTYMNRLLRCHVLLLTLGGGVVFAANDAGTLILTGTLRGGAKGVAAEVQFEATHPTANCRFRHLADGEDTFKTYTTLTKVLMEQEDNYRLVVPLVPASPDSCGYRAASVQFLMIHRNGHRHLVMDGLSLEPLLNIALRSKTGAHGPGARQSLLSLPVADRFTRATCFRHHQEASNLRCLIRDPQAAYVNGYTELRRNGQSTLHLDIEAPCPWIHDTKSIAVGRTFISHHIMTADQTVESTPIWGRAQRAVPDACVFSITNHMYDMDPSRAGGEITVNFPNAYGFSALHFSPDRQGHNWLRKFPPYTAALSSTFSTESPRQRLDYDGTTLRLFEVSEEHAEVAVRINPTLTDVSTVDYRVLNADRAITTHVTCGGPWEVIDLLKPTAQCPAKRD